MLIPQVIYLFLIKPPPPATILLYKKKKMLLPYSVSLWDKVKKKKINNKSQHTRVFRARNQSAKCYTTVKRHPLYRSWNKKVNISQNIYFGSV